MKRQMTVGQLKELQDLRAEAVLRDIVSLGARLARLESAVLALSASRPIEAPAGFVARMRAWLGV